MDNFLIRNGPKLFSIAKETQELLKKLKNDLKNVSRHCGGHYNIETNHFEDSMSNRVNDISKFLRLESIFWTKALPHKYIKHQRTKE